MICSTFVMVFVTDHTLNMSLDYFVKYLVLFLLQLPVALVFVPPHMPCGCNF